MNIQVITCAVFPAAKIERLYGIFLKSCEMHGVSPFLYGVGYPWTIYRHIKLEVQLEFLKKFDSSHVLYTDGPDAVFLGGMEEIERKYQILGAPPILASASFQLANVSNEQEQYPGVFAHDKKYCYPHVGGYIAERAAIIKAFEDMLKLPRQTSDDCFNWFDLYQFGGWRPQLDSGCQIFQVSDEDCAIQNGRVWNLHTNSHPAIWHLSGGYFDPEDGRNQVMRPIAEKLGIL